MKESEILIQVSQIVSAASSFTSALEMVQSLLQRALGAQALTVELSPPYSSEIDVVTPHGEEFLESLQAPYRSLYSVPLRADGRELGKLIACYGSFEFHSEVPARVSNYTGEQLGMLLERTQLGQDRSRLEAEVAELREDLGTRKTVQRALGILATRRAMTPASAELWISRQARQTRRSIRQVAEHVIALGNAQRWTPFTPSRQRINGGAIIDHEAPRERRFVAVEK